MTLGVTGYDAADECNLYANGAPLTNAAAVVTAIPLPEPNLSFHHPEAHRVCEQRRTSRRDRIAAMKPRDPTARLTSLDEDLETLRQSVRLLKEFRHRLFHGDVAMRSPLAACLRTLVADTRAMPLLLRVAGRLDANLPVYTSALPLDAGDEFTAVVFQTTSATVLARRRNDKLVDVEDWLASSIRMSRSTPRVRGTVAHTIKSLAENVGWGHIANEIPRDLDDLRSLSTFRITVADMFIVNTAETIASLGTYLLSLRESA